MSNMVKIKHHHSSQEKPYYTFHLITHKFLTKEVGQLPSKPIATMSYVGNFTHRSVLYGKRIGLNLIQINYLKNVKQGTAFR